MDRRYKWRLEEYTHVERPLAFESYHWENEPLLRQKVREATGLEHELATIGSEWSQILKMLEWVHNLSAHQGFSEAPSLGALDLLSGVKNGTVTFRCVEFSHMLQQVCSAFGIPARVIGVRLPKSDVGLGKGHVVVDAWSNDYQKWVVLDPEMNMFYTDGEGNPLSVFEIHDRVRNNMFDDIVMSREAELRVEADRFAARDNTDYESLEVPEGFTRDELWDALPEHSGFEGFAKSWKQYYYRFTFRREYSFVRDKSVSGSSGGSDLFYYDEHELPPIVFQQMRQACEYTCDRTKIDFKVNAAEIQWVPCDATEETPIEDTRKITVCLRHSMPWFGHFEVHVNDTRLVVTESEITVNLREHNNAIVVTPVSQLGRRGSTSVLRVSVN